MKTEQQTLWDWLKAERRHQDAERRRVKQQGVSPLDLPERRKGRPKPPLVWNRATRRALGLRRIKK